MRRIRSSPSICRGASIAIDACGSATNCRGSSCGTCGTGRGTRSPTGWADSAESLRELRRVRGHVSDGSARGRERREARPGFAWTRTTCPYCGTGCEMAVGTRDGGSSSAKPVTDAPVSKGHLCVKGRYAFDFVRPTTGSPSHDPHVDPSGGTCPGRRRWHSSRTGCAESSTDMGRTASACWDRPGRRMKRTTSRRSSRGWCIGTNNVDCCARVCHAPSAAGMKIMLGTGLATNSFDDIELARTILVCGANPPKTIPSWARASSRRCAAARD